MSSVQSLATSPWALEQLEKLHQARPELVDDALEQVLARDEELRWALVLSAYLDDRINLGKAAELLGMPETELREKFMDLGLPLRLGSASLAEAQAEVDAFQSWISEEPASSA